ncbi:MAG TPA: thioredoxin family protein [Marinilabiliales bacterium]|jgi:peroxiredoxin|nr:MAG: redoxin [Bacteroidetes bacterium GWA2_40_14]OFX64825.1 MAG: redoxin [Bacteroidetes bacterium GWC2_40_13]OFX73092.1 MAG: redoxin [Bacteroidetes bacterium GWD2_40_43]OFX95165.1 MAG: redoxin [Bacteroidetes bacterium GWE2_40_63]OFY19248.1 MAG: redoxin [Bacteroidetes bacterium GWF2_40_13]OFZ30831.1 MAG: redoxin [Bacteroidetes bacterium RIFOXYC2_FULL_40_12]HAM97319.1 thioredoxin family protein [Marinilabiliales bacterium]
MKNLFVATCFVLISVLAFAQGYKVGDEALNFKLMNIDGKMVSLTDYSNEKGVVVIFTCNHCPYSVAYEDRIVALDKEFKAKGFPVVAINPNDPEQYPEDSYENMKVRAKEKGFTFPYLFDEKQEIFPVYGATKTPHVYLLRNENGKFKVAYIGAIDNSSKDASLATEKYLESALNNLLAGKSPDPAETKAIGCSIKAKK